MSPADVPAWVGRRHADHPGSLCRVYCNLSTWPAVKAEVAKLSEELRALVRYWIADPTGVQHQVPGADATQWYFGDGYDLSVIDVARWRG